MAESQNSVTIVNAMDYFSYGKILREYDNGANDRYLTTSHERDPETGLDYRGARYYDSDVARFLSLDPLRSKRASINPYNYVSGNPIMRIDPTGMIDDNYTVDTDGNIQLKEKTNDNFDRITGTNSDGKNVSIEIEKGFITPFKTESLVADRTRPEDDEKLLVNYNVSFYGGSLTTATKVFEFMANVTKVEWGLFKFGENSGYPTGILTTSHDQSTDVAGKLIKDPFFFASDFFGHDHIHPGGSTTPSGYLNDTPSGDIGFALGLIPEFKRDLTFRIFTKGVGYTPYDTRTIFDDEIIIKPK